METEEKPPWWSTREGTLKICVKCNQSFKDYTSKLTHTLCRRCWKMAEQRAGFQNERLPKDVQKKGRNYQCDVCRGTGKMKIHEDCYMTEEPCDDCLGTGMGEIEGTSELQLGR